jgi:hypothetical protein
MFGGKFQALKCCLQVFFEAFHFRRESIFESLDEPLSGSQSLFKGFDSKYLLKQWSNSLREKSLVLSFALTAFLKLHLVVSFHGLYDFTHDVQISELLIEPIRR